MTNSEQRCWLGLMMFMIGLNIFVTIIHNWPTTYPTIQTPTWVYEPDDYVIPSGGSATLAGATFVIGNHDIADWQPVPCPKGWYHDDHGSITCIEPPPSRPK